MEITNREFVEAMAEILGISFKEVLAETKFLKGFNSPIKLELDGPLEFDRITSRDKNRSKIFLADLKLNSSRIVAEHVYREIRYKWMGLGQADEASEYIVIRSEDDLDAKTQLMTQLNTISTPKSSVVWQDKDCIFIAERRKGTVLALGHNIAAPSNVYNELLGLWRKDFVTLIDLYKSPRKKHFPEPVVLHDFVSEYAGMNLFVGETTEEELPLVKWKETGEWIPIEYAWLTSAASTLGQNIADEWNIYLSLND